MPWSFCDVGSVIMLPLMEWMVALRAACCFSWYCWLWGSRIMAAESALRGACVGCGRAAVVRCGSCLLVCCRSFLELVVYCLSVRRWLLVACVVGTVSLMWVLVLFRGVVLLWWCVAWPCWQTPLAKRVVSWARMVLVLRECGFCNRWGGVRR